MDFQAHDPLARLYKLMETESKTALKDEQFFKVGCLLAGAPANRHSLACHRFGSDDGIYIWLWLLHMFRSLTSVSMW